MCLVELIGLGLGLNGLDGLHYCFDPAAQRGRVTKDYRNAAAAADAENDR